MILVGCSVPRCAHSVSAANLLMALELAERSGYTASGDDGRHYCAEHANQAAVKIPSVLINVTGEMTAEQYNQLRTGWAAAAEAVCAAERERIRQLAIKHQAHYHSCGVPCLAEHSERPFAELLTPTGDPS